MVGQIHTWKGHCKAHRQEPPEDSHMDSDCLCGQALLQCRRTHPSALNRLYGFCSNSWRLGWRDWWWQRQRRTQPVWQWLLQQQQLQAQQLSTRGCRCACLTCCADLPCGRPHQPQHKQAAAAAAQPQPPSARCAGDPGRQGPSAAGGPPGHQQCQHTSSSYCAATAPTSSSV